MGWFAAAGFGLQLGSQFFGGRAAANAAAEQARLHNEAMERQYQYNVKGWKMNNQKLIADRAHAVDEIATMARNQNKQLDYTDAMNARQYQYNLLIRNREQQSLDDQFTRSEEVYATQTDLNAMSAQTAYEDERRQLDEIRTEQVFDRQDAYIENLINEGKLRATGVQGRSAQKGYQVTAADFGNTVAQLDEAFAGAGRNSRAAMKAIATDLKSADLAAYAQRMLDPGDIPLPLEHLKVVRPETVMPRALGEFDFGPRPVMGATQSPSAAAGQVWGQTFANMGSTLGGYLGQFKYSSKGGLHWPGSKGPA